MNTELAKEFLLWLDAEHRELTDKLYTQFKKQQSPKKYMVFWTFVANFADYPVIVEANSIEEAIRKGYVYDPEGSDDNGNKARFLVCEIGGDVVHNGYFDDIGKEPCIIEAKTGDKTGYDWKTGRWIHV